MNRFHGMTVLIGGALLASIALDTGAQTPAAKPAAAQEKKAVSDAMAECVARAQGKDQAKVDIGPEAAKVACREQREAERLKETGPHSSSEATVNSPTAPAGKMSASGHSSHSATSGTEPSKTIQESKNSAPTKP